jgi:putative membrane protein
LFYLPRILVNLAESRPRTGGDARLQLMGRRLYRFGHIMFRAGADLRPGVCWWGFGIAADGCPPNSLLVRHAAGVFRRQWSVGSRAWRPVAGCQSAATLRLFNEIAEWCCSLPSSTWCSPKPF